jgi:hypothetical protein
MAFLQVSFKPVSAVRDMCQNNLCAHLIMCVFECEQESVMMT